MDDQFPTHDLSPVSGSPSPEVLNAVRAFYVAQREELTRQITDLESFLGFVATADDLAVRVAKLEAFVGVKA